jgi:hypothetical protein
MKNKPSIFLLSIGLVFAQQSFEEYKEQQVTIVQMVVMIMAVYK